MSRLPLFPVDSEVLGKVVAPVFFPSVNPPDCFAQGLLKADGTLDPSVPSTVVKFINLGSPQFRVFALHGKFSRHGVMSSEVHPAVLLWATFNGEHISDARFGTIEPINKANKYAHIPLEIHATFGMSTHGQSRRYTHPSRLLHQPDQARWRCTEVVISDPTFSSPFFRYDCTTEETFVEFIAIDANADAPFGGPGGGGGGRFDEYVPPSHRITITPDRGTISMNVSGSKIMPSVNEVKQAEEMFMKCDALLQSKFGVIEWLEDHRVERREQPEPPVNAVFNWMNGFRSAIIPRPSIFGPALMPGMTGILWKKLMQIDPTGLSAHAAASNRVIQPCECTPTRKNPMCNNRFCPFKHSGLILLQPLHKQQVSDRFETRAQIEAKKANPRGHKAAKKAEKAEQRELFKTSAAASAAAASVPSPAVSQPKPASASASEPVSSASVKSTVTKPDSKNKGGSRTRKRRHRGL